MHFDDRLATVLEQPASGDALARIQYRQLVDILGRLPATARSRLIEQGFIQLRLLAERIGSADRARLLRHPLQPLSNARLLKELSSGDADVACAAIATAQLEDEAWLKLIPALPVRARGILRHRRDLSPRVEALLEKLGVGDRALPPVETVVEDEQEPAPPKADLQAIRASVSCSPFTTHHTKVNEAANATLHQLAARTSRTQERKAEPVAEAPPAPPIFMPEPEPARKVPPTTARLVSSADAVEEMVLTQLLGPDMPEEGHAPRPEAPMGKPTSAPELARFTPDTPPPSSPPPTSLREWARMKAGSAKNRPGNPASPPSGRTAPGHEGIGEIVRRIEEFRRARAPRPAQEQSTTGDSPRLPLGDALAATPQGPATIDFTTDALGRVDWADGPYAGAIIGNSLAAHEIATRDRTDMASAIGRHLPVRGAILSLEGAAAISGEWQADAAACFDPQTGQFTGHAGRLRRLAVVPTGEPAPGAHPESDTLRQVLHELRTPANAIQVSAEIIQQQLYGPAPHEYRALAALVAGDCAHILAGFEELDRLVRLETGALVPEAGESDLAAILCQTMERLNNWTGPRSSGLQPLVDLAQMDMPVALNAADAERLVWRLIAALVGAAVTGEQLATKLTSAEGVVTLEVALPAALAERDGDEIFAIGEGMRAQALTAGIFGIGFTLRLAAAEAASAGGSLVRQGDAIVMALPGGVLA